jgi:hypothetical protein
MMALSMSDSTSSDRGLVDTLNYSNAYSARILSPVAGQSTPYSIATFSASNPVPGFSSFTYPFGSTVWASGYGAPLGADNLSVVTVHFNGHNSYFRENGIVYLLGNPGTGGISGLLFGSLRDSVYGANCRMAMLAGWPRALTATELGLFEQEMASRIGATLYSFSYILNSTGLLAYHLPVRNRMYKVYSNDPNNIANQQGDFIAYLEDSGPYSYHLSSILSSALAISPRLWRDSVATDRDALQFIDNGLKTNTHTVTGPVTIISEHYLDDNGGATRFYFAADGVSGFSISSTALLPYEFGRITITTGTSSLASPNDLNSFSLARISCVINGASSILRINETTVASGTLDAVSFDTFSIGSDIDTSNPALGYWGGTAIWNRALPLSELQLYETEMAQRIIDF